MSGPLARFGTDGARALEIWARSAVGTGPVEFSVHDAHPEAAAAMTVATGERPDLVFGPYGSGPTRTVLGATDRLIWNHGGAAVDLAWGRAPNLVNVLSPADTYLQGTFDAVRDGDPSLDTMSLLHSATGFGRMVADGADRRATQLGFEVRRRAFPKGDADRVVDAVPPSDVLCVAAGFTDEVALGEALLPGRWRAAVFVGAGEEHVLDPLSSRREGLLGPSQWLAGAAPRPEIGPTTEEFVDAFRAETGQPPSYPAAQAFAAGVLASHAVETAGTAEDAALLEVVRDLETTTLFGRFRLDRDTGRQTGHEVLTVQWQDGRRHVVWPRRHATAGLRLR